MTQTHYRQQIHERDAWKEKPEDENIVVYKVNFSCFYIALRKAGFFFTEALILLFPWTPHKQIGSLRAIEGAQFGLSVPEGDSTHHGALVLSVTAPAEMLSALQQHSSSPAQTQAWLAKILCRNKISNLPSAHSQPLTLAGQDEGEGRIKRFPS